MRNLRIYAAAVLLGVSGAAGAEPPASAPGLSLLEAVRTTLERDPNLAVQKARLESARGSLQIASSQFDPVVTSALSEADDRTPLTPSSHQELRTLQSTIGVTQQFRTGLSIAPQAGLVRTEDAAAPGTAAGNASTVTFVIRQPLLRGRGRAATAAGELAAQRELGAAGLDLRHTVAQRLVTVVTQYWTVLAAVRNLDVLLATEASSRDLLENTRRLIAADQVPAAEQVQLEANLAAQESARIGGERQLFTARRDLGREIGLDDAEINRLPLPADSFPAVPPEAVPPVERARPFIAAALRQRADLRAARERQTEAEILRRAAVNALQPQLDLIFSPGYSGLVAGADTASFFSPLVRSIPGASASVALSLTWPTLNRRAQGELLQTDAVLRQNALAVDLIAKEIGANVPAALDAVSRDARQLAKAGEAERLFERAVVNEERKLRAGTSTLLDVITQRDRLTSARQTEVSAQLALALSLLQLRFETGTLVGDGEAALMGTIQVSRLTTLPSVEEERLP
jgi:outer membrane protein